MIKIYKVTLYDGTSTPGKSEFKQIESIIVRKTPSSVNELLTGYRLSVFSEKRPLLSINERTIKRYGHQPAVKLEEFLPKNLATAQDIDDYVEKYESSEWNKMCEEMKLFTIAQKTEIDAKAKQLFKSRTQKRKEPNKDKE